PRLRDDLADLGDRVVAPGGRGGVQWCETRVSASPAYEVSCRVRARGAARSLDPSRPSDSLPRNFTPRSIRDAPRMGPLAPAMRWSYWPRRVRWQDSAPRDGSAQGRRTP